MKFTMRAVLEMFTKGTDKAQKEVGGINKQLDQAADNAARMNKNLSQTQTGKGRAGVDDTRNYRTQRGIAGARGASGRDFAALARAGDGAEGSFVGAYASLAANIFAVTAAFQALSNAARTEQLTKGLELMGARGGVALTLTAKNLQAVTDNAISAADAMKATAQAASAGFSGDEIERLGKVARGASLALGRDMGDALDRLTKGAIKLEPELLDELGIMTRLDDAVKTYADANNKAVSALNQTERRQAFLNAVLEEGERKFSDINDQIATNPFDQLSASVKNTATQIGTLANTVLGPIAKFFAENPFALLAPGIFLISKALQGLGISATVAEGKINKLFDKMVENRKARDIIEIQDLKPTTSSKDLARFVENEALTSPDKLTSINDLKESIRKTENATEGLTRSFTAADKAQIGMARTSLILRARLSLMVATIKSIAVTVAVASLQMLAFTALFAGLAVIGAGIGKLTDYFRGLTPEIKESRAKLKELADQANETAKQVRMMLEPGSRQAGNAFDAIANSAKAASDEIENYNKLLERRSEEEEKGIKVRQAYFTIGTEAGTTNQNQYATRELAQEALDATGNRVGVVEEQTTVAMSIEQAYTRMENTLTYQLGMEKEKAKLLVGNYKAILSQLSVQDEANALSGEYINNIQETIKAVGEITIRFKDLEESAKKVNTLSRDLFPKETKNALRDLSKEFKTFSQALEINPVKAVSDTYTRGLADTFLIQKAGVKDTLVALKNQGVEIKGINVVLQKSTMYETALTDLSNKKLIGDKAQIKEAEKKVQEAQKALGISLEENAAGIEQLSIETEILGLKDEVLQKNIAIYKTQEKLISVTGANAKSALEYSKSIQDSALIATGGDVSIPEEYTYEYKARIASLEADTAKKLADMRKKSIDLETKLEIFKLNNQKIDLADKRIAAEIAAGLAGTAPSPRDRSIEEKYRGAIYKPVTGEKRDLSDILESARGITDANERQALLLFVQSSLIDDQIIGVQNLAKAEQDSADAAANSAGAAKIMADANVTAFNNILVAKKRQLTLDKAIIDRADKLLDVTREYNSALYAGASISEEAQAYSALANIPLLDKQISIAEANVNLQTESLTKAKAMYGVESDIAKLFEDKLAVAQNEQAVLELQKKTVQGLADSYQNGLQSRRVALDLAQKELQASKDLQASRRELAQSESNLARSVVERGAREAGREVTPFEQEELKSKEAKIQMDSAIEDRLNMQIEHNLALKNLELEKELTEKLYLAEASAIRAKLAAAGVEKPDEDPALVNLQSVIDRIAPSFDAQLDSMSKAQANREKAANKNLEAMVNDFSGLVNVDLAGILSSVPSAENFPTPEAFATAVANAITGALGNVTPEDPKALLARMQRETFSRQMNAANKGLQDAALGAAAPLFDAAPEGREAALSNPDRRKEIHLQARALAEVNAQAKLLSDLSSTIDDGFTNIFLAAEQGSKAMGEAFTDMAKQILRQIALMTIKMLAFKAIEAGLNFLAPGAGTAFVNFINPGAAGGIIGLANGGIMGRPAGGLEGIVKQPTYLVGEGRYNEAVVPLPNGRSIPVQMHGGGSQSNNVAVTVNMSNNGSQTQSEGQDPAKLGQAIAAAVQRELVAQKAPGGLLNRYSAI